MKNLIVESFIISVTITCIVYGCIFFLARNTEQYIEIIDIHIVANK